MKRKSLITILAVVLMAVLSLTALVACDKDKDKHEFASEWSKDETGHWHACTLEGHTDTDEKVAHTWNEGVVTTAATEDKEGVKTFTCTVCGQTKTEPVAKLAHTHKFNTEVWEKDDTNHWNPATCEHATEKGSLAPHSWNEGEVTTATVGDQDGVKTFTCTVCGQTKTEVIPAEHAYATEWSKDETAHWHACTIDGHTDTDQQFSHSVDSDYTCVCGYQMTNSITFNIGKKVYNGKANGLTEDDYTLQYGTPVITYYNKGDTNPLAEAPKNAGEYTVKVSFAGDSSWPAVEKTANFTIEQKELTYFYENKFESQYSNSTASIVIFIDDGETKEEIEKRGIVYGDKVAVLFTFSSPAVGTKTVTAQIVASSADYFNPSYDYKNYKIDSSKVKAEIVPRKIHLKVNQTFVVYEFDTRNEEFAITDAILKADTKTLVSGEEAFLKIDTTGIAAETFATITENMLSLTGANAGNYQIVFAAGCKVRVNKKVVTVSENVTIDGAQPSTVGAGGNITYGSTYIDLRGEQDGIYDYINNATNKDKNIAINVYHNGSVIAKFERLGVDFGIIEYAFNYGNQIDIAGGPGTLTFDFVDNYTANIDGQDVEIIKDGQWVYNTDSIELTFDIVVSEISTLTKDTDNAGQKLSLGKTIVYKFEFDSDVPVEISFTYICENSQLTGQITVYDANDGSSRPKGTNGTHKLSSVNGKVSGYVYVEGELVPGGSNKLPGSFTISFTSTEHIRSMKSDNGVLLSAHTDSTYMLGEVKAFTTTFTGELSDVKYKFEFVDANGNDVRENFIGVNGGVFNGRKKRAGKRP